MNASNAITMVNPEANSVPKRSGAFNAIIKPRNAKIANMTITIVTPIKPLSSAMIERIKSVCGSGK